MPLAPNLISISITIPNMQRLHVAANTHRTFLSVFNPETSNIALWLGDGTPPVDVKDWIQIGKQAQVRNITLPEGMANSFLCCERGGGDGKLTLISNIVESWWFETM